MGFETWEGIAVLTGYGATIDDEYPIEGSRQYDSAGELVKYEISDPTRVPGPLGSTMYKQTIKLTISADPSRIKELAMETILDKADAISFLTDRRVRVSLDMLRRATSHGGQPEEDTMLYLRQFKGPQDLMAIDVRRLQGIAASMADLQSDRGRRIARALRWLRRAYLADDEVEEYATLAMGYEALTSLLPEPPKNDEGEKENKRKGSHSSAEILTHWAVGECGISEDDWRRVGRLRNGLFHGGLTENAETRSELTSAIPYIRLALGLALKHVLKLSDADPPHLGLPPVVISDLQITAPTFTPASDPSPETPQE